MPIESLRIQGFRSLRDVTWHPGRLNVLIGPNGSGKSNLLGALELLSLSAKGDLSEAVISQGGMGALLWDGQARKIGWSLIYRFFSSPESTPSLADTLLAYHLEIQSGWSPFRVVRESLYRGERVLLERIQGKLAFFEPDRGEMVEKKLLKSPKETKEESALPSGMSNNIETHTLAAVIMGWSFYHDIQVGPDAPLRQAAVARVETQLDRDAQNLIPVLHTLYTGDREFERTTDSAMRAAFGNDYEKLVFPPAADQRIQLRVRWRSLKTEQPAANLSDGTLWFLILLALLADPDPAPLIAIDEPEAGLHPGMFPIIAELAAEAAQKTQVLFTTHSPQFLDAFTEAPPTTTVAQMVDGETRLSVLDGEELRRWLKEYSLGALFRSGELEGLA